MIDGSNTCDLFSTRKSAELHKQLLLVMEAVGDQFGESVAISGNYAIVGALKMMIIKSNSGRLTFLMDYWKSTPGYKLDVSGAIGVSTIYKTGSYLPVIKNRSSKIYRWWRW